MDSIKRVIDKVGPDASRAISLSVACIATTNPVYLVFDASPDFPRYVVRAVNSDSDQNVHQVNVELFISTHGLVPEPLGLVEEAGVVYSVQKGVEGVPWFQIARTVSSPKEWACLRRKVLCALKEFHEGTQAVPEWHSRYNPARALRKAFDDYLETGGVINEEGRRVVEKMKEQLKPIGEVNGFFQHGDFSLNNLIVSPEKATVIDLEDFGITSMPLYDEFTLALSMAGRAPVVAQTSLPDELIECTKPSAEALGFSKPVVRALFLSHLLVRLGPWSMGGKRVVHRNWLVSLLNDFLADPTDFIPD